MSKYTLIHYTRIAVATVKMMVWFISSDIWRESCNLIKCFNVGVHIDAWTLHTLALSFSFTLLLLLLLLLNGNKKDIMANISAQALQFTVQKVIHLLVFYGNEARRIITIKHFFLLFLILIHILCLQLNIILLFCNCLF